MTKICFVGAGMMAKKVHYPSLASFEDVEIVGICDLDAQKLQQTAATYNIANTYQNYQQMVEEQAPDGIYVIGPPHYMYDIIRWCLEQKLPVFCEKPLGLSLHQTQMLAELAKSNQVITQVGHQRRSSPILNKVLTECREAGPITHAVCEFYKYDINPLLNACDHLHDDGSHSVDTLRWICGGEVVGVESHVKRIGTPDINWVLATLHFDNGSTGILINNWASGKRIFRLEIHAPSIFSDIDLEGDAFVYTKGDLVGHSYNCQEVAGSSEFYVFGGFKQKSREFIDSIQKGKELTSSPFSDVLKTMEVVESIVSQQVLKETLKR